MMRALFALVLLLVAAVGLSFGVENRHLVTFHYYVGEMQISLALLLVLAATAGVAAGAAVGLGALWSVRRRNRGLRRQVAVLQAGGRNGQLDRAGDSV